LQQRIAAGAFGAVSSDCVRSFVTHHHREFIIAARKIDHACVHRGAATRNHPCVHLFGIVDHSPSPFHSIGHVGVAFFRRLFDALADCLHAQSAGIGGGKHFGVL